jgi:hypothetical protein
MGFYQLQLCGNVPEFRARQKADEFYNKFDRDLRMLADGISRGLPELAYKGLLMLELGGYGVMFVSGAALSGTVIGAVAGVPMMFWSADQMAAMMFSPTDGPRQRSMTSRAITGVASTVDPNGDPRDHVAVGEAGNMTVGAILAAGEVAIVARSAALAGQAATIPGRTGGQPFFAQARPEWLASVTTQSNRPLVFIHLTSPGAKANIDQSQRLGGKWGIFALEEGRVPKGSTGRMLKTLSLGDTSAEVCISGEATLAFNKPPFFGPISTTRRLAGVRSTPIGSIDLANSRFVPDEIFAKGVFRPATRQEIRNYRIHQFILDYGFDIGIYTIGSFGALHITPEEYWVWILIDD